MPQRLTFSLVIFSALCLTPTFSPSSLCTLPCAGVSEKEKREEKEKKKAKRSPHKVHWWLLDALSGCLGSVCLEKRETLSEWTERPREKKVRCLLYAVPSTPAVHEIGFVHSLLAVSLSSFSFFALASPPPPLLLLPLISPCARSLGRRAVNFNTIHPQYSHTNVQRKRKRKKWKG